MSTKIKQTLGVSILMILIASLLPASTASADTDSEKFCTEVTQYFNPEIEALGPGDDIDYVEEDCLNNNHHDPFPGAHKEPIDLTEHPDSDKSKHQPLSDHIHRYINLSVQEETAYYYIFHTTTMEKFELRLQNDFEEHIDLDSVQCSLLPTGNNCNSAAYHGCNGCGIDVDANGFYIPDDENFENQNIVVKVTFDKANGIITWYFPGFAYGDDVAKVGIAGENPLLDPFGAVDSSNPDNRRIELGINFETKDNSPEEAWSATSTSRFYVKDFSASVPKSEFEDIESDEDLFPYWQAVQNNYYWFAGGTATTIWEKEPPEEELNICQVLDAELDPTGTENINERNAYRLYIKTLTFSPLNIIPENTKVRWTSEDPDGEFWQATILYGDPYDPSTDIETFMKLEVVEGASGPFVDLDPDEDVYYIGDGPVKVWLIGLPEVEANSQVCEDTIQIPAGCETLRVNHPEHIYEGTVSRFSADALDITGNDFESPITYSVDSGYGFFYTTKPEDVPDNPSDMDYEIPVAGKAFVGTDIMMEIPFSVANGSLWDMENEWYEIPEHLEVGPLPGPDLSPLDFGGSSVIDYAGTVDYTMTVTDMLAYSEDLVIDAIISEEIEYGIDFSPLSGSVTVDSGTVVYLVALKPGEDVVHVKATNADEGDCERDFDIEAFNICDELKVNYQDPILEQKLSTFSAKALNPIDNIFDGKITYSAEEGYGTFYTEKPATLTENEAPTVTEFDASEAIEPPEDGFCTDAGATSKPGPSVEKIPGDILVNIDEASAIGIVGNIVTGNEALIIEILAEELEEAAIEPQPSPGPDPSPLEDVIKEFGAISVVHALTVDTEGSTITVDPGTEVYFWAEKDGENVIHVDTNCTDELNCRRDFDIGKEEPSLVCESLTVTNYDAVLTEIEPGEVYKLKSQATYSTPLENATSTYTSTQGVFLEIAGPTLEGPLQIIIDNHLKGVINSNYLNQNIPLKDSLKTQVVVPDGDPVFFITFTDADTTVDALIIQATGRSEAECTKKFAITEAETLCQSISVNYLPTPFDPTHETLIWVQEGDYGDFQGNFNFTATNNSQTADGKFYQAGVAGDELNKTNPREFTIDQSKAGIIYAGGKEDDTILIEAVGELNGGNNCRYLITAAPEELQCLNLTITKPAGTWTEEDFTDEDEDGPIQKFKISVTTNPPGLAGNLEYRWEVSPSLAGDLQQMTNSLNSNNPLINYLTGIDIDDQPLVEVWAEGFKSECSDWKKLRTEEGVDWPDIEKAVYDTKDKEWANTINVGGQKASPASGWLSSKYRWITYLAVFEPGSAKSAEIWEEELDNGRIEASNTHMGEFVYQGMAIAVEGEGNARDYILYKSSGFDEDRYNNEKISSDMKISRFDNFDEDIDFLDNYKCGEEESDEVCFENSDPDGDFMDGKKLELKYTDRATKIYIVYQMQNNTAIDDIFCRTMIQKYNACGEEFPNEINFTAYEDDDFDTELEDGKDDATVIVICPFILTREGGDVFFHSALETGIDISVCYEVEGGGGTVITPDPEKPPEGPVTGPGDIPIEELSLIMPSHDICKLSNTGDVNIEAYKNVFENFSSAVCEMRTEVAEDWKEKYINEAIKANIEKIARFGESTTSGSFSSVNEFNFNNGVFVTNGDITIDSSGDFLIAPSELDDIPAAQTYIIKDADLTIKSNIKYDDSLVEVTDPKSMPSVAFIVIDGNINISNNVTHLDGIYMAVDTEREEDGKINSLEGINEFENILTIKGSLIGNVYNLYSYRRAIGDPLKDESSITIKYDERIMLNTPPGLNELIDVSQLKVAN